MEYLQVLDFNLGVLVKLLLAALLGGIVGLERELEGKPAGLRTNMFICLGSALFTVLSNDLATAYGGDPTRIASQLIPGIGFIGAGSIIRARGSVLGLTTAASIFVLASIGMAVGAGRFATALFVTLVILLGLRILGWLEKRLYVKKELRTYRVRSTTWTATTGPLMEILERQKVTLHRLSAQRKEDDFEVRFDLDLSAEQHTELFRALVAKNLICEISPTGLSEE